MRPKQLAIATVLVFIYLIVINAFVFPFVFPDGLAEKFINMRADALPLYHVLAFAATAFLLTVLVGMLVARTGSKRDGLIAGALLGLLVALPEHLHLYAMIDVGVVKQFIPVVWIVITWGIAGVLASLFVDPRSS